MSLPADPSDHSSTYGSDGDRLSPWPGRLMHRVEDRSRVAIAIGPELAVVDLARRLRRDPDQRLSVIGACIPLPAHRAELMAEHVPVLGGLDQAAETVAEVPADLVLVCPAPETSGGYIRHLARHVRRSGQELLLAPENLATSPEELDAVPPTVRLYPVRSPELATTTRVIKAAFDRVGALVLLVIAALFLLLVGLAIKLETPGPVLCRRRCVGRWGQEVWLLRFRTTSSDGSDALERSGSGTRVAVAAVGSCHDPVPTRVGRLLEKWSLADVPQLVNVLKGDIAIVGPRAEALVGSGDGARQSGPWLQVKPGLTGLWHFRGSSADDLDRGADLDDYAANWSLSLDIGILVRWIRSRVGDGP